MGVYFRALGMEGSNFNIRSKITKAKAATQTKMNTYNVTKKRDGQSAKHDYQIYALDFAAAKKQFASDMTKDNYEKSNNFVFLWAEIDSVPLNGWYDLQASTIRTLSDPDCPGTVIHDYARSEMHLFCSQEDIDEGFEKWNEDVWTWEILDN